MPPSWISCGVVRRIDHWFLTTNLSLLTWFPVLILTPSVKVSRHLLNLILSRLSSLNKSSSHTFHPKNSINNDKKYKCVHISYPRINGNCHIELDYQTGLKFELSPVTNIHVKKNYLPGKYLGYKTVGKVNLIFPSGSTDNSAIKPIVNRAVSPAGKLPILH